MLAIVKNRLSPFRHRDFRNLFMAQTLSMVGTWSHDLARSWIVVETTGSSGALGTLNTAVAVPVLFLILQGGVLVDRSDVRHLLQRTKSLLGLAACILAALTQFTHLQYWQLLVYALVEGIITAYDAPAFSALTVRLVPRTDFQQAIALNSTNFHTSRMLGPIVAAWLMAMHGPSLVFLFDGLTYMGVAFVLSRVSAPQPISRNPAAAAVATRSALREGLNYILGSSTLRYRVLQLWLSIACIHPMMVVIFRVFVKHKFNLNAGQFGEVFSFPALGSMSGALIFAILQPRRPIRALLFGVPLVFIMLLTVPWMPTLPLTVAAMSLTGFGLYLTFASLTVSLQLDIEESYRGRLSSLIGLGFSSLGPLMGFPWGYMADFLGAPQTIAAAALVFGLGSAWLAWSQARDLARR